MVKQVIKKKVIKKKKQAGARVWRGSKWYSSARRMVPVQGMPRRSATNIRKQQYKKERGHENNHTRSRSQINCKVRISKLKMVLQPSTQNTMSRLVHRICFSEAIVLKNVVLARNYTQL